MKLLHLSEVSHRTGIAIEKLNYCIQNGMTERSWLLPEHRFEETGSLDIIAAVHVACGAILIDNGVFPAAAKTLMKQIAGLQRRPNYSLNLPIIATAINGSDEAVVQIADGTHVRWRVGNDNTGWFRFTPTREEEPNYEPVMVIALHVSRIRDLVRGNEQS